LHFAKVELREGLKELLLVKLLFVGEEVGDFFSNVPPSRSGELRNCVLSAKIKILAKRKREFTTKFAILQNGCVCPASAGHTL